MDHTQTHIQQQRRGMEFNSKSCLILGKWLESWYLCVYVMWTFFFIRLPFHFYSCCVSSGMTIQYRLYYIAYIIGPLLAFSLPILFSHIPFPHMLSSKHKLPFHNAFMRSIICLLKSMLPHNMLQDIFHLFW